MTYTRMQGIIFMKWIYQAQRKSRCNTVHLLFPTEA